MRPLRTGFVVAVFISSFLAVAASQSRKSTQPVPRIPVVLWKFDAGGAIWTTPVASRDLVFVTVDSGKIFALSKKTGKQVWQYDTNADKVSVFRSDPLLYENAVIVGATLQDCATEAGGFIYSFNQRTGKVLWKTAVPDVRTNSAQVDNTAIFGTGHNEWVSINLRNGNLNWTFRDVPPDHHCYEFSSPATDGVNVVVVANSHTLFGLNAEGHKLWEKPLDSPVSTSPFAYKDVAYVGTVDKHVYGVDPATGGFLVDLPVTVTPKQGFIGGGEHDNELEYSFGSVGGNKAKQKDMLLAYSDEFQNVLWSRPAYEPSCETPYYWQRFVLVGNCSGQVAAYRGNDGRLLWNTAVKGCVRRLSADGPILFVGVEQGTLYGLGYLR